MGKGDKRHRSRAKKPKALAGLELAETPKPKARGRKRMGQIQMERNLDNVALKVRAQKVGYGKPLEWDETNDDVITARGRSGRAFRIADDGVIPDRCVLTGHGANQTFDSVKEAKIAAEAIDMAHGMNEAKDSAYAEDAGRAIMLSCEPDAAKVLTALYENYTKSYRRYMLRCIGLSPDAKVAKIEMTPDRMETRADDRPDLRSEDEKDRDAANSWARYHTALGKLSVADRSCIEGAGRDWVVLVDAGEVTAAGKRFVAAMEKFSDAMPA